MLMVLNWKTLDVVGVYRTSQLIEVGALFRLAKKFK